MILKVAKSIDEYLEIIKQIKSEISNIWFRGQSDSSYMLEPSLFREKGMVNGSSVDAIARRALKGKYVMQDDITALYKFQTHYNKINNCSNYKTIDYLYVMQHYGIPTRLLDFTSDELVGLYFSVSKSNHKIKNIDIEIQEFHSNESFTNCGSAVFCIDPIYTNEQTFQKKEIVDLNEYNFESLGNIDFPVCCKTNNPDKRINAQKGNFVFFGNFINPYDYYDILNKFTYKIFIPNTCRKEILIELKNKYSISHSTIYPDIEGVVMEIKDEIKAKFIEDCKKWSD